MLQSLLLAKSTSLLVTKVPTIAANQRLTLTPHPVQRYNGRIKRKLTWVKAKF